MTSSIVTTHYRYRRPPRKRKPVAIEAPAVVTAKSSRRPPRSREREEAAAEVTVTARHDDGGAAQPTTPRAAAPAPATLPANDDRRATSDPKSESRDSGSANDVDIAAPSANDDRPEATSPHHETKSAIVTIKRKSRFGDAPDLTPEEHQRRGEAADALWRGLVDQATAKDGKSAAVSAEPSSPATKPAIVVTARKRRSEADRPHLPMELPLFRKPVERDGDDYKRMKAAMARRLRPGGVLPPEKR